MARRMGAFTVNFERKDPVGVVKELTGGIGADRVIDAVGVDAVHAHGGPAAAKPEQAVKGALEQHPHDGAFVPGDAPSQSLRWGVECIAKAGTLGIIGVYPPKAERFPSARR